MALALCDFRYGVCIMHLRCSYITFSDAVLLFHDHCSWRLVEGPQMASRKSLFGRGAIRQRCTAAAIAVIATASAGAGPAAASCNSNKFRTGFYLPQDGCIVISGVI